MSTLVQLGVVFRVNLRDAMAADPRSLSEIARASGYSRQYISRFITGAQHNPSLLFVDCMAATLGADPLSLLTKANDT